MTASILTSRTVERPGYALHVEILGTDVPLLLVHHALGSFASYSDQRLGNVAEWLAARGCRVVGFDLPGHGRSTGLEPFPEAYLERCAGDAVAVLDALEIGSAAVVGIGFGGWVGLQLAAQSPGRVQCVIADSLPGLRGSTPPEPWPGLIDVPPREAAALAGPYRAYVERTARLADAPWHAGAAVRPVLLLGCGEGDGSEAAALHEFARNLADAQVAMVPAANPPACWSAPRFFVLEAERFLAAYA